MKIFFLSGRKYSILLILLALVLFSCALSGRPSYAEPAAAVSDRPAPPAVERSAVYLKDGNVITGEILKNKNGNIIIDNLFQVFLIPADKIGRVEKLENILDASNIKIGEYSSPDAETAPVFLKGTPPGRLFNFAVSRPASIENLVERYENGVVQIKTPSGSGSGFVISDEGHILTNCHVIENETEITVTIFEKNKYEFNQIKLENIKIIALNPFYDLALLKIEDKLKKPIVKCFFAKTSHAKKGESVFAIGNPYGLTRSISQGIISDSERYVGGLIYIQTTAPINAGNSGGPLFNMNGEVIGVINMAYFLADGIGFGIPLNYVYDFLANVEAYSFDKDNPNSGHMYNKPPRRSSFDDVTERTEK